MFNSLIERSSLPAYSVYPQSRLRPANLGLVRAFPVTFISSTYELILVHLCAFQWSATPRGSTAPCWCPGASKSIPMCVLL